MNVARRSKVAVKSYHFLSPFGCNYLSYIIPLIKTCWFIFAVNIEVALNFIPCIQMLIASGLYNKHKACESLRTSL
jgi:hypothetical protein